MALAFSVSRRAAAAAEVDAALERLDHAPGLYFGCDAGVPGLHPLQATLLVDPALALHVHADGAVAEALDASGAALLGHPALAAFNAELGRGAGRSAVRAARAFLAAFGGAAEALLAGALRFEAHRLGGSGRVSAPAAPAEAATPAALGVLFFAPTTWRRDASGDWQRVELRFDDAALDRRAGAAAAPFGTPADARDRCAPDRADRPAEVPVEDDFPPGGYARVVARALERLAREPLVSLTLSQSFRRRVGDVSALRAFASLRRANPAPATFFVNAGDGERLFGASPDLQLRVRGDSVEAFPVCGTVARGHGPVGEAEALRCLFNEEVDAASLAVCTDALRNDLAPLCVPGSMRLEDRRRPMALATVVHTVDRLVGRLRPGADAWDAIVATAAPVMVTGTPRRHALAAIEALEAGPRGWYGGLVVQVGADGAALVGTILRAAALRDGVAEVRTGGDLMVDSNPQREEAESRVKAVSLWRALGLAVEASLQTALAGAADAPGDAAGSLPPAVALHDAGDPFAAAVTETLLGMGLALDAAATPWLLIGADAVRCVEAGGRDRVVAVGDAAARVLQQAGFAVRAIAPQHGRLLHCVPSADAPWPERRGFVALRSATLELDPTARTGDLAGWVAWVHDERARPVVLAHAQRRVVCLLMRPESLLSDPLARHALRAAIAFAA